MTNAVWIEIELPSGSGEARDKLGEERAERLSIMLQRLGVERGSHKTFWWSKKDQCYCYTSDTAGSYSRMEDKGMWFNLDFLGRDLTA